MMLRPRGPHRTNAISGTELIFLPRGDSCNLRLHDTSSFVVKVVTMALRMRKRTPVTIPDWRKANGIPRMATPMQLLKRTRNACSGVKVADAHIRYDCVLPEEWLTLRPS